jgi:hypothetical protein
MPRRQPCPLQDGRRQGRHALMSRPDITTGNTDFTPTASLPTSRGRSARSALANLGWLATQSRNDLPRQLVLASHAIPFRLAALPRDDSGRLAALQPACWVPPPIYKPHVFMSLSLSLSLCCTPSWHTSIYKLLPNTPHRLVLRKEPHLTCTMQVSHIRLSGYVEVESKHTTSKN